MKKWNLLVVAFLAAMMIACSGKTGKKLVVAVDATFPPMEYVSSNKQIVGFDIDLIKGVAKEGGFEVEIKNTAWNSIFNGLAAGKYDAVISSITINEERKKNMDFSRPYLNAGQVIIVSSDTKGVSSIKDLTGKTIGAQIGTTGSLQIEKYTDELKLQEKTYDKLEMAIEDLTLGKIDAVMTDTPIAANYVLQNKNYKGKLKIIGSPLTQEYCGVAVKKGNQKVLDMINKGLTEVLKKNINKDLEDKWLR